MQLPFAEPRPWWHMTFAPAVLVVVALIIRSNDFAIYLAITAVIAYIFTVSFNLIFGYAGIFSLAHAAVYGIGAYGACLLEMRAGFPFLIATICAMVVCAFVGILLWWPTRHLKDLFLAIATLGFAVTVEEIMSKWTDLTGGAVGLLGIPIAEVAGHEINSNTMEYYWLAAVGALVAWEISARLTSSAMGRKFIALREAPIALAALGVSPGRPRLVAFIVSSALAGLAGSLFAHQSLFIASESFGLQRLIFLILAVLIGGAGTLLGPVVGVVALVIIDELGVASGGYSTLILGFAIIILLGYGRGGIVGLLGSRLERFIHSRRISGAPHSECGSDVSFATTTNCSPLCAEGVSVDFGGVQALSDVSLEVRPGQVVGLIGPNGAGKTTLVNTITGHVAATTGRVTFGNQCLNGKHPYAIARYGVTRTFQTPALISEVSIVGNVALGFAGTAAATELGEVFDSRAARRDSVAAMDRAVGLLHALDVRDALGAPVGSQPYALQRLTEIARALATSPKYLLLDEPGAGLNDHERATLAVIIRRLADSGIGVILIDHNVNFVAEVSDVMQVLDGGRTLARGNPATVLSHNEVIASYFGVAS